MITVEIVNRVARHDYFIEEEYECGYCGNLLDEDYDDVIFIDLAFMPSGDVFCNEEWI